MSGDDDVEINEVDEARNPEVEEALKALKYVRQKFNLIRSQLILSEAVRCGGLREDQLDNSHAESNLSRLEDKIDRLCIQEGALQHALESDTINKIRSSGVLSSELQESLSSQLQQEAHITTLVSELSKEYSNLQSAQDKLSNVLEKYRSYEKKQAQQLKENNGPEDNERLKIRLKEIRFMQLMIPRIIGLLDNPLEEVWLGELAKEIRDPILSVDEVAS